MRSLKIEHINCVFRVFSLGIFLYEHFHTSQIARHYCEGKKQKIGALQKPYGKYTKRNIVPLRNYQLTEQASLHTITCLKKFSQTRKPFWHTLNLSKQAIFCMPPMGTIKILKGYSLIYILYKLWRRINIMAIDLHINNIDNKVRLFVAATSINLHLSFKKFKVDWQNNFLFESYHVHLQWLT